MAGLNGRLPAAQLTTVPGQPTGSRLRIDAAASFQRMSDECWIKFAWRPQITSAADAYRIYAIQERIFIQRYTTRYVTGIDPRRWDSDGNGIPETWWRLAPFAAAAIPGTSNHGWGLAVDLTALGGFKGTKYKQLESIAGNHGWDNNEGRSIAEAWHWVYKPTLDKVSKDTDIPNVDIDVPGGSLPDPLKPEDELSADDVNAINARIDGLSFAVAAVARMLDDPKTGLWTTEGGPASVAGQKAAEQAVVEARHAGVLGSQVLNWIEQPDFGIIKQLETIQGQVIALNEVLRQVSGGATAVDLDAVRKVVDDALADTTFKVVPRA